MLKILEEYDDSDTWWNVCIQVHHDRRDLGLDTRTQHSQQLNMRTGDAHHQQHGCSPMHLIFLKIKTMIKTKKKKKKKKMDDENQHGEQGHVAHRSMCCLQKR